MPITVGPLSARVWRVIEALPPHFTEIFERNIKRHAFRPVNAEKGEERQIGWVNAREALDANLNMDKVLFKNVIAIALRVDRISINPRVRRSALARELQKAKREHKRDKLPDEQRQAIEEKVRLDLLKEQTPAMSVYEVAWNLESGLILFGASGNKINEEFRDYFTQTFNVSIEPQLPFLRAERWAKKQKMERELREVLPSPFSPDAPAEVVEMEGEEEAEGEKESD